MRTIISFSTSAKEEIVDITEQVKSFVLMHRSDGYELCSLYAMGATSAIIIQENWDPNIKDDLIRCIHRIAPKCERLHGNMDGYSNTHIEAGLIGPSEVLPIEDGQLLLSTWQKIFFCEFDGPRKLRKVIITLV